jgi:phospholipase/carboxylesterase
MEMLEYDIRVADDVRDGAPLIVLLHGRGSDKDDLMGLAPHMPSDAMVVAPRAPFPGAPWGYGAGWAWYRFLGRDRPEPDSFSTSLERLDVFLATLPDRLPVTPGPLTLGGFSQGGTLSLAYALTRPARVPSVLNFSGFLADHPAVAVTAEAVAGTRIFWGHGTRDPNIPFELALEGRARLEAAGAELESRDYEIGHWIDDQELRDAVSWMGAAARTSG